MSLDTWRDKGEFRGFLTTVTFETDYIFDPTTNLNDTFQVVERMREDGWFFRLYMAPNGVTTARFWWPTHDNYPKDYLQDSDKIGTAICLAALKAKGVEV